MQKAYRGIMAFMSDLRAHLESKYPAYTTSAVYPGYMDMTYFAFTPSALKDLKLKIAIVYLHEEATFELWLAGSNRQVRADLIELRRHRDTGRYALTPLQPVVDSIIATSIAERPDFDQPDEPKRQIEAKTIEFTEDMLSILR